MRSQILDFSLKQFDTPLIKFSATEDTSTLEIGIFWVNADKQAKLFLNKH